MGFDMNELLEKIKSRGYWKAVILPAPSSCTEKDEKRVSDLSNLQRILEKTSVQLRPAVWDFPHLSGLTQVETGPDWIGQEIDLHHHVELWRFHQSGRFVHYRGMPHDWRDQSKFWPPDDGWETGASLGIDEVVSRFTEIFELAGHLTFTEASGLMMHVEVTVGGLKGRTLSGLADGGGLCKHYEARIPEFTHKVVLMYIQMLTDRKELARSASAKLFQCFGWDASAEFIRIIQTEVTSGGWPTAG
jgi:hypothetical protein